MIYNILTNPEKIRKIEFWAVTLLYVLIVFSLIVSTDIYDTPKRLFDRAGFSFNYYENYFFPALIRFTVVYLAFLVLNFRIVPKLVRQEQVGKQGFFAFLVFLVTGILLGIVDTYSFYYLYASRSEGEVYSFLFRNSYLVAFLLLFLIGLYALVKRTALLLVDHSEAIPVRYRTITKDGLGALVLWIISMILLLVVQAEWEIVLGWGLLIPFGIALYSYSFYALIPASLSRKRPLLAYIGRVVLLLIASALPVGLLVLVLSQHSEFAPAFTAFNAAFQFFITAPLSWVLYNRYTKDSEKLHVLQKELGQSNANFDFLRSQINPHFLFNALNTIYGTAIQEKAERTSEGIEKLGDMMRFMLQENMQEKIPLAREVEYLTNYIGLQKLRTDPTPTVRVQADIEQPLNPVQIAPMLLIPFVENAFKHGISLREPSHIVVSLEVRDKVLYFDVHNSKHPKSGNDPEKDKSGIGLANVTQRLKLLYPNKHNLIIRETGREFFVHLTINL